MFGSRHAGKVVLVADIDDASVGVAIVALAKSKPATVLVSEKMSVPMEERTPAQSAAAIVPLLEHCTDTVLKTYAAADTHAEKHQPSEVYAVVRAPWTRSRTAEIDERYDAPRVITKDLIASLAKKALQAPSELDAGNILEAGVTRVSLNGYPTGNPVGKKATRASVVVLESDINADIKRGVTQVLEKMLPGRTIIVKSGMRAALTFLHEIVPDIHRYVIFDMGGGATTLTVIRKEAMFQTGQVPEGKTSVLKRVTGAGLPEETLTQFRMLAADTCATDACKNLKDAIARAEPDITKIFGEALAKLAAPRRLPNAAILIAPAELAPWLQGFFSRIDFAQFTATMQPFSVEALLPEHVQSAVMWKQSVAADTGIGIAAGYVNILEEA